MINECGSAGPGIVNTPRAGGLPPTHKVLLFTRTGSLDGGGGGVCGQVVDLLVVLSASILFLKLVVIS